MDGYGMGILLQVCGRNLCTDRVEESGFFVMGKEKERPTHFGGIFLAHKT